MPVEHVFRSNVLALEDAIRNPEVQIGGLVVLLDMAGLGFAHARYLSPHLAKRTVEVVQEGFPMRFKGKFENIDGDGGLLIENVTWDLEIFNFHHLLPLNFSTLHQIIKHFL